MTTKSTSKAKTPNHSKGHRRKGLPKTKKQACIDLLKRPKGASLAELKEATGWQAHTVKGFLSRTVRKLEGGTLVSEQTARGERRYRAEAKVAS